MADSSVLLEVIVEGKNIKVVQRDVDKLAASVNKAAAVEEKSSKGKKKSKKSTDDLNNSNKNYNKGQKGVAGATSNSTKAFSKQRDLIGGGSSGLVGAYATLAANIFAATALFGALKRASQVEQLTKGLATLGAASGLAMMTLSEGLREATGNAISLEQSMRSVATITSAGLDPSSIVEFGEAAANASKALGRGLEDTLDRITRGVTKLEPELLDEIGVFVRLDEVTKEYAESIGKTTNQLSNFEKRLAFQAAVLTQLDDKFGAIGDTVEANPYDKLAATFADLTKEILLLVSAIEPLLSLLAKNPVLLLSTITALGGKVISNAVQQFNFLDKGIARAEKSAAKLNKALAKEIRDGNATQKSLGKTTEAIQQGTIRTKGFTQALNNQATSQATNLRLLNKGGIEQDQYNARMEASKNIIRNLNKAEQNNLTIRAKRSAQLAVMTIQEGNLRKGMKLLRVSMDFLVKSTLTSRLGFQGWTTVARGAQAAAIGLATSIKVLGVAFLTNLPLIGLIIAALTILYEIGVAVYDFFNEKMNPGITEFNQKLESATETVNEVNKSFAELDRYLGNSSSLIGSTAQKYTALNNIVKQLLKTDRDLENLKYDGSKQRVALAEKAVAGSKILRAALEKQYGVEKLSDLKRSPEEALKAYRNLLIEIETTSNNMLSLKSSTETLNQALQNFGNEFKIDTPFTEASDAVKVFRADLERAIFSGKGEVDALRIAIDGLGRKELQILGGEDLAQFKDMQDEANALRKAIEKIEDRGGILYEDEETVRTIVNGKRIELNLAAARDRLQEIGTEQKKISKTVDGIAEKRGEELENAEYSVTTAKLLKKAKEEKLKLLQKSNINTRQGTEDRIASTNTILDQQKNILTATLEELRGRKAGTTDIKEKAYLSSQILALETEIKNVVLDRIDALEGEVMLKQSALNALQEQQKYEKFSLNIQKQQAKLAEDLANSKAKLLNSSRELDRATTGTGLTSADRADQAEAIATRLEAAAKEELRLTTIGINMEYDLLDAKYALIEAELDLAIASGKLTAEGELQARVALERVKKINLEGQRKLAIEVAGQKSLEKSTIARNNATIARIKAEDEAAKMAIDQLRNRADFYESLGDMATATAMRELALTQERAILERQIQAGKTAGLDVSAVEFDRLKKMQEFIAAQKGVVGAASQGATTADRVKSFQGAGGFGAIDKAAEGQKEILTERRTEILSAGPPSSEQQAELDGIGVALERIPLEASRAKIAAMREQLSPMLEELKQLGPQGAVAAAIGEGSFVIQDSLTVLGTAASTSAEKLAAVASMVGAVASIMSASSDSKIASIDAEIAAEKKRDGKSAASLAKIKGMEAKKEKMARKAFDVNKKLQMASILISTASAAMAAWAPPPLGAGPLLGGFLTAAIIAMGAAQLAIVAGTSYQGGGSSGGGSMPSSLNVGERSNSVDVSQKASGSELAGLRGGDTANIGGMPPTPAFMGAKYRAAGGPTAGYVVGEQGPELFVPETPGKVVPNDDMRQAQPMNVNFTIQAIDSSNFTDALTTQRGNIISMIREAANTYGETFLESVNDTAITTGNGKI